MPGRASLAALTSAAAVAAMFGLGVWSFNDMRAFGLGSPKPGPHCNISQPNCPVIVRQAGRRVAPGGPATQPSLMSAGQPSARTTPVH